MIHTLRNRRNVLLSTALVSLLAVALTACNGGGSSSSSSSATLNFVNSTLVIGQANATSGQPNRGGVTDANTLATPTGRAAGTGPFYIPDASNNRILGFSTIPTTLNEVPDFILGQTSTSGNAQGTSTTAFNQPVDLWSDGIRLVLADAANNRVLIWNSLPSSANVPASVVVGQSGTTTAVAAAGTTGMSQPSAVATGGGKLIVADKSNNRVLIFNTIPSSNGAAASVVLGQPDFATTTVLASPTASSLSSPSGVWTDGQRLLVADTGNHRVLYWSTIPTSNATPAALVIGQLNLTTGTQALSDTGLANPTSVHSDGTRIFIADTGHNRVLIFNSFPLFNQPAADIVLGQKDFVHSASNDNNQNGSSDTTPSARTLSEPTGVFATTTKLFVSDRDNSRVLVFVPPY